MLLQRKLLLQLAGCLRHFDTLSNRHMFGHHAHSFPLLSVNATDLPGSILQQLHCDLTPHVMSVRSHKYCSWIKAAADSRSTATLLAWQAKAPTGTGQGGGLRRQRYTLLLRGIEHAQRLAMLLVSSKSRLLLLRLMLSQWSLRAAF